MRAENDNVTGSLGIGRAVNGWLTKIRNTMVSLLGLMSVTPRTAMMAPAKIDVGFNIAQL